MAKILVTDYDGTMTERDVFSLVVERRRDAVLADYFDEWRAGRMSHFDAMAAYFSLAPDTVEEMDGLLAETGFDAGAREASERLREAGWEIVVVSAGCGWYIERTLARWGVRARVISNPGRIEKGRGLVLQRMEAGSAYYCEDVGVDKCAVMREALARGEDVAFAGDGPPDEAPALMVGPERRFARGHLAANLEARGERFRPFGRWSDIAAALL